MAESYILNNILCFLVNKLRNSPDKLIRSILLDYYDVPSLSKAKYQLKTDIAALELPSTVTIPHVPDRREGDQQAVRVIDDIFILLKFIDNNLLMSKLPTYVTDNPDNIPSMRVFEGDLATIVKMIANLEDRISMYDKSVRAELAGIHASVQQSIQSVTNLNAQAIDHTGHTWNKHSTFTSRLLPAVAQNQNQTHSQAMVQTLYRPLSSTATTAQVSVDRAAPATTTSRRNSVSGARAVSQAPQIFPRSQANVINVNSNAIHETIECLDPLPTTSNWANSTSTPVVQHNMFSALMSAGSESDEPFIEAVSSRTRRARRRRETNEIQRDNNANNNGNTRRPGARLLVGTGGRSDTTSRSKVTAAKPIEKPRVVLYVDNLAKDCATTDLINYVKGLSVNVISCYTAVPRHRRGTEPDEERTAFRLCIIRDDLPRILDPSAWPDHVVLSEWVHKPPNSQQQGQKRTRLNNSDHNDSNTAAAAANNNDNAVRDVGQSSTTEDMDTTVVYNSTNTPSESVNGIDIPTDNTVDNNTNHQHGSAK